MRLRRTLVQLQLDELTKKINCFERVKTISFCNNTSNIFFFQIIVKFNEKNYQHVLVLLQRRQLLLNASEKIGGPPSKVKLLPHVAKLSLKLLSVVLQKRQFAINFGRCEIMNIVEYYKQLASSPPPPPRTPSPPLFTLDDLREELRLRHSVMFSIANEQNHELKKIRKQLLNCTCVTNDLKIAPPAKCRKRRNAGSFSKTWDIETPLSPLN